MREKTKPEAGAEWGGGIGGGGGRTDDIALREDNDCDLRISLAFETASTAHITFPTLPYNVAY